MREPNPKPKPRAGRPSTLVGRREIRVCVDAETIQRLEQIHPGNMSAAVREAARLAVEGK